MYFYSKTNKKVRSYIVRRTVQSYVHFIPDKSVHSNTNSTSLGSIQPRCNYCAKTICSHTHSFQWTRVLVHVANSVPFENFTTFVLASSTFLQTCCLTKRQAEQSTLEGHVSATMFRFTHEFVRMKAVCCFVL